MPDRATNLKIEEWDSNHLRYAELTSLVESQGQLEWFNFRADWHISTHILVALNNSDLVGFLRFVVQPIGPDTGCPPIQYKGINLIEAKVIAFAVDAAQRSQGMGRQLQIALIEHARSLDCYQIRSHSSGKNTANHQLKLSLGYAAHPIIRGDDYLGVYFILPLGYSQE